MTTDLASILDASAAPTAPLGPGEPMVERLFLRLPLWPEAVTDWRTSYGKYASLVLGPDGSLSCAEAEIVRRLRASGFDAVWIDNFGSAPANWKWASGRDSTLPDSIALRHQRLKAHVLASTGRGGGCWDVVAWRGSELLYLESKGPGDSIKPGQQAWRAAGLAVDPAIRWVLVTWAAE